MNVSDWQNRLERTFTSGGVVGGVLLPVLRAERKMGNFVVRRFHGHVVLADCFQAFFIKTLQVAETAFRTSSLFRTLEWYAHLLCMYLGLFRTVRAGEILLVHGRPGQGYGLLRDVKDSAIVLGAFGNGFMKLAALHCETDPVAQEDFVTFVTRLKEKRKRTESASFAKVIGPQSRLTKGAQQHLRKWQEFFHLEVHGGRLSSMLEDGAWMKGRQSLSICPQPTEESFASYMNRFSEISWMLLRTFPLLQLEAKAFGPEWAKEWGLLDDSFRVMVKSLGELGKPIAAAIAELIEKSFNFSPDASSYPPE